MLAEPWGYARENIAPLVLVEVWAARQRRPTLVRVPGYAPKPVLVEKNARLGQRAS